MIGFGFGHKYPYTDFHEMNLDWLLNKMRELEIEFDEFKVVNNITFSGQWDITKQYPAWTIVSDNNIGYVSKQPVPAGIPLSNGNYWVEVIDYTAQIAGLESRVIDLENHDLVVDGEISDINTRIDELNHKRYVFIGDSYNTTDTPLGGVPIVPWSSKLVQYLDIDASDYYNIGHSGSGFVHGTETFITLLNQVAAGITDKDSITDVVVLGGINDNSESLGDLNTALDDFITRATILFPNALITIGFISWIRDEATRTKILDMIPYYEDKAKYPNVRILSNAYKFYHYYGAQYQPDGHPNVRGSEAIAQGIANFLKHGFANVHWKTAMENLTISSALNITSGIIRIGFDQNNEYITTHISIPSFLRSSGFTLNTGQKFVLGTFNYLLADFNLIRPISGVMYAYSSDTGIFYNIPIVLEFEHNQIVIEPLECNNTGTFNITSVSLIQFDLPNTFNTPIEYC